MLEQPNFNTPTSDNSGRFTRYWQNWLASLVRKTVTAHTMTIPKLTVGGTNGEIGWDEHGRVIKYTDPT